MALYKTRYVVENMFTRSFHCYLLLANICLSASFAAMRFIVFEIESKDKLMYLIMANKIKICQLQTAFI